METSVRLCLGEVKQLVQFARNKRLDPLRQAVGNILPPEGTVTKTVQVERGFLNDLEKNAGDLEYVLNDIFLRLERLLREADGKPSYPGGEVLPNEPHAFKARSG